jgi:hypothetical protein
VRSSYPPTVLPNGDVVRDLARSSDRLNYSYGHRVPGFCLPVTPEEALGRIVPPPSSIRRQISPSVAPARWIWHVRSASDDLGSGEKSQRYWSGTGVG